MCTFPPMRMRVTRRFRTGPVPGFCLLAVAAFYVLLGVSAAWHAPHFSRDVASVDVDRHDHHEAVGSGECALCSLKQSSHAATPPPAVSRFAAPVATAQSPSTESVVDGFHGAARARAPPLRS